MDSTISRMLVELEGFEYHDGSPILADVHKLLHDIDSLTTENAALKADLEAEQARCEHFYLQVEPLKKRVEELELQCSAYVNNEIKIMLRPKGAPTSGYYSCFKSCFLCNFYITFSLPSDFSFRIVIIGYFFLVPNFV